MYTRVYHFFKLIPYVHSFCVSIFYLYFFLFLFYSYFKLLIYNIRKYHVVIYFGISPTSVLAPLEFKPLNGSTLPWRT